MTTPLTTQGLQSDCMVTVIVCLEDQFVPKPLFPGFIFQLNHTTGYNSKNVCFWSLQTVFVAFGMIPFSSLSGISAHIASQLVSMQKLFSFSLTVCSITFVRRVHLHLTQMLQITKSEAPKSHDIIIYVSPNCLKGSLVIFVYVNF